MRAIFSSCDICLVYHVVATEVAIDLSTCIPLHAPDAADFSDINKLLPSLKGIRKFLQSMLLWYGVHVQIVLRFA